MTDFVSQYGHVLYFRMNNYVTILTLHLLWLHSRLCQKHILQTCSKHKLTERELIERVEVQTLYKQVGLVPKEFQRQIFTFFLQSNYSYSVLRRHQYKT